MRSFYTSRISRALSVNPERARLVEGFLRLQYGTLDALTRADFIEQYFMGGIREAIEADPAAADRLATSYGLPKEGN